MDGVYHGIVKDEEGELGYGRLWFYYEVAYSSDGIVVMPHEIKVTSIGAYSPDALSAIEELHGEGVKPLAVFVSRVFQDEWPSIAASIIEATTEEEGE